MNLQPIKLVLNQSSKRRNLRFFGCVFLTLCISGLCSNTKAADAVKGDPFKNIMNQLDQAYFELDTDILSQYTSMIKSNEKADSANPRLSQKLQQLPEQWQYYTSALVHLRLATKALYSPDDTLADSHLDRALELLSVDSRHKTNAEFAAMRSSLLGMKISLGFMRGMTLGGKADRSLQLALKLSPDSAQVLLFQGISLYSKPALFGGDTEAAITTLGKAIALYDSELAPYWGYYDMLFWYAKALIREGNTNQAASIIVKLRARFPDSPLVDSLDRQLNKALKK